MKKSLISLLVMGALASGAAQAQTTSVTVFGIIDAGVMYASKAPTNSVTAFQDAQMLPSIYGLKGTEDLGDGLKAGFVLEGGFNSSNGTHNSPGVYQSQMFGREAKVTLSGDWGTIGAGLQVDPAVLASIATEPRGMSDSLSMVDLWIIATVGNGSGLNNANTPAGTGISLQGGLFDASSVTYTYHKNGLYLGLEYGFGGVAGNTSANATESIGVSYTNSGFTVSAGYVADKNGPPNTAIGGNSSSIGTVGLAYTMGDWSFKGQYGDFKVNPYLGVGALGADEAQAWGIGVDWKTSAANTVNLSYYDVKDQNSGPGFGGSTTELALMDTYKFSKRTSLYGQIASVKADANAGFLGPALGGIYTPAGLTAATGVTTSYLGFGVQHSF